MEKRNCLECGIVFEVHNSPSRIGRGKYCSKHCSIKATGRKHGHTTHRSASRTYNSWYSMKSRCKNHYHTKYNQYGAVGISVCERWKDFKNFLNDMGERPPHKTIDRIDSTKNYFLDNCRWATPKEQQRNLRNNVIETFQNKSQCISAWAEELGISHSVLSYRIKRGWKEKAFTTPVKYGNRVI